MKFCTSAVSNGSHVALSQQVLSLLLYYAPFHVFSLHATFICKRTFTKMLLWQLQYGRCLASASAAAAAAGGGGGCGGPRARH